MLILAVNANTTETMTNDITALARKIAAPGTEIIAPPPPSVRNKPREFSKACRGRRYERRTVQIFTEAGLWLHTEQLVLTLAY